MATDQEKYYELSYYTLSHPGPSFIHQNIVDAFTAQTADEHTKPIGITFALVGLYLTVEKDFTGKKVQQAHMQLAKHKRQWPIFSPPSDRGTISIDKVLEAPAGKERDEKIRRWCVCVWSAYKDSQQKIRDLVKGELGIS